MSMPFMPIMDMPHHHVPPATPTSTMDMANGTGSMDSMDSMGMSSIVGSAGQVCKVQVRRYIPHTISST